MIQEVNEMSEEGIITGAVKKVFLAGVGAAAVTADKSAELFSGLVEKGATTVERGREMNRELKHNAKQKAKERKEKAKDYAESDNPIGDLNAILAGMTAEQLDALGERIDEAKEKAFGREKEAGEDEEKKD